MQHVRSFSCFFLASVGLDDHTWVAPGGSFGLSTGTLLSKQRQKRAVCLDTVTPASIHLSPVDMGYKAAPDITIPHRSPADPAGEATGDSTPPTARAPSGGDTPQEGA